MSFFSEISGPADKVSTGTLSAVDQTVQVAFAGHQSGGFVLSGTWSGTIICEGSVDNGTTWVTCWFSTVNTSIVSFGNPSPDRSTTINGSYKIFNASGFTHYRVRALAWTSGTANVTLTVVYAPGTFLYTSSAVIQQVAASNYNSSTTNLASGAKFVGLAEVSLSVAAIQVSMKADQNCEIYVDQSPGVITGFGTVTTNGTVTLTGLNTKFIRDLRHGDEIWVSGETVRIVNEIISDTELTVTVAFSTSSSGLAFTHYAWDISDEFHYYTAKAFGITVQAVNSYYRVRAENISSLSTTFFRLQTALCPIVECVPRALSEEQNLKTGIYELLDEPFPGVTSTPSSELRVTEHNKLTGSIFEGSGNAGLPDPNFWSVTNTNGGTAAQTDGALYLRTNTTANGATKLQSVSVARYIAGMNNYFRGAIRLPAQTGTCTRRWGAYDDSNGYYFEYNGTSLKLGSRKTVGGSTTDSLVTSFNGDLGETFVLDTNTHIWEIFWSNTSAWYFVDGLFLHKTSTQSSELVAYQSLKISAESINSGGNTNNNYIVVRSLSISRLGSLHCEPRYKYQAGAGTVICKYGPGKLSRIVAGLGVNSGVIAVYDNTAGSGTLIASISTTANQFMGNIQFDVPFYTGLTVVVTGAMNVTIIYE